jgi:hypothetical protein
MIHVQVNVGLLFWFYGHSGVQGVCRFECFALLFVLKHENSFHSYALCKTIFDTPPIRYATYNDTMGHVAKQYLQSNPSFSAP